jgi:hypothetical protein
MAALSYATSQPKYIGDLNASRFIAAIIYLKLNEVCSWPVSLLTALVSSILHSRRCYY